MPLVPNRWTEETLADLADTDVFSEGTASVFIRAGWHDDPATGDAILIEQEIHALNQYGTLMRRDVKKYEYEIHGAPPLRYSKETYSSLYLPDVNIGRALRLVDREVSEYFPWSSFQPLAPNLSRKTIRAGYVIYTTTPDERALTTAQKKELEAKGFTVDGPPKLIVDSASPWHTANHDGTVVERTEAPQTTRWVDPYESEVELVFEEPDKYTIYTVTKNHLKPQDIRYGGPRHQRKPSYSYRLPVAIEPPTIKASAAGDDGVKLEVSGGGADVLGRKVQPEKYRILRRIISEPSRSADPDPYGLYDTPPGAAPEKSTLWIDTDTTDLAGAPASSLPSQTPYTEPGDADEAADEGWTMIGELDNANGPDDDGYATMIDGEVLNDGNYEYVATALIGQDESAPSSPVRFHYGGANTQSRIGTYVRRTDDGLELDISAPTDPDALPDDYGETLEYEIPLQITEAEAEELGEELGRRHFADDRDSALEIEVDVTVPLITLERGQLIKTPAIEWTTTGNDLVITSETESREWLLDGFRLSAKISEKGKVDVSRTTLYLTER